MYTGLASSYRKKKGSALDEPEGSNTSPLGGGLSQTQNKKSQFRRQPGKRILFLYERSRYMYENK
jgi:hypothetical protein